MGFNSEFKGLNAELIPIYYLLALLGTNHILHVSRTRVKKKSPIPELQKSKKRKKKSKLYAC